MAASVPRLSTAPVLAILVCHNGEEWLPEVLDALRRLTIRPRHLLAVDTGSSDGSPALLARAAGSGTDDTAAGPLLDGILTPSSGTGFGAAVAAAVEHATERWGDPGQWLWLLHDDSAPEPDCLQTLLQVADADSGAAMLGPLGLDWQDPRLVIDAGLSMDTSGHQQTGMGQSEPDPALNVEDSAHTVSALQVSETLAVSTACALIRRTVFERLEGFDEAFSLGGEDIDLGWRINADGHLVLRVPGARMRHRGALRRGARDLSALPAPATRAVSVARRAHGVRTFLVNSAPLAFALGLVRLFLLTLLRGCGFTVLRRIPEAAAEFATVSGLLTGRFGLLRARAARRRVIPRPQGVRGLLTSRLTRLRNGVRGGIARLVRNRVRQDVMSGRTLPVTGEGTFQHDPAVVRRAGPEALPAGAPGTRGGRRRGVAGLRRPSEPVVVPVATETTATPEDSRPRPSPVSRDEQVPSGGPGDKLLLVPVDRSRVLRGLLLSPPVLLVAVLLGIAVLLHGPLAESARFGAELHGGRLLATSDLAATWSEYLAAWHPAHGGTGSPAPASLLVLAALGTVLAPVGGVATGVAVLLLLGVPLAGLSAYAAARFPAVPRSWRAAAAAAYALLPAATMSAAQGRLGVVVAHILMPVLLSGIASVVGLSGRADLAAKSGHWLGRACLTALGLAVLGAFAPVMHLVLVVLALLGFVLVPGRARSARGYTPRRTAGLFALVLLPVACLLPWPVAVFRNPQILVHGLGARVIEDPVGMSVAVLSPGGSPASWTAGALVIAAIAAIVLAPCRAVLPGIVVALTGWATAVIIGTVPVTPIWGGPSTVGWTGAPLVLAACGLVWIVLAAAHGGRRPARITAAGIPGSGQARRVAAASLVVALLAVASGAVLAGRSGPLRVQQAAATPAFTADPAGPGLLLSLNSGPQPARLIEGGRPRFGTDAVVPTGTAVDWLHRIEADLLSGQRSRVRSALAAAAARGAGFIAVPDATTAAKLHGVAGDLVADSGELADGRAVLRLLLPSSPVELLGPALARQARKEKAPAPESWPVVVEATLPHVTVRVSQGAPGRLLVLGAENEAGWQARVDGRAVPLATAWGHQVAVPLPEQASRVRVTFTELPRTTLLAVQAAAILFTLIGALPQRRRMSGRRRERPAPVPGPSVSVDELAQRPSMTPGSSPR
ncbi:glycosyltransferase [Haloactinomyces albus]|uniref:GT2 family glycosyltransferase n=1 Tax=Haloactinomyces albus TaxID=1352928 RepID=A0AAE4CLG6_9ACTN|nr:glycosyltransferase [Haloactinomyces albus]MDR7301301.1 GT2 family glycosyltransferase [Haloactinomyces albus]